MDEAKNSSALDHLAPHPILFAPMVGISHFAVRQALSEFLPRNSKSLWPTEMLNSRRLPSQKANQVPEINFKDFENGLNPQLLGNEEGFIRESVKKLEGWGARSIDINMGCPVDRALKHNYGVALMGDISYASKVVEMTVRASSVPVSVKLRSGFSDRNEDLIDFTQKIAEAGASWITLHPRLAQQKRKGQANWNQISVLRSELKISVVGNGDIQNLADIQDKFSRYRPNRVMVGRALLAKPWLMACARFGQEQELLFSSEPSAEEKSKMLLSFLLRILQLSEENYTVEQSLKRFRFLTFHLSPWLEFGHAFTSRVRTIATLSELKKYLEDFFSSTQHISESSTLRN